MKNLSLYLLAFSIWVQTSGCKIFQEGVPPSDQPDMEEAQMYFGLERPTRQPLLFAPGVISLADRQEFGLVISKNGREVYFGIYNGERTEIHSISFAGGSWSPAENMFPNDPYGYNEPRLSYNENRLFFISNRYVVPGVNKNDIDIWYVERVGSAWSGPKNPGLHINNHLDQYSCSFTSNETMYFASRDVSPEAAEDAFDIYRSDFQNGYYTAAEKLPKEINTSQYEADVFISPDESYLIFCSIRPGGLGQGDLYISYKTDAGQWTDAINMGNVINTQNPESSPFVSRDGKYLFYTSNLDIYWVSTDIIDDLKRGNAP